MGNANALPANASLPNALLLALLPNGLPLAVIALGGVAGVEKGTEGKLIDLGVARGV